MKATKQIKARLEHLRTELRAEQISYGELAELQSLSEYIEPGDVELREAAGVPEFPDKEWECEITRQICYCSDDNVCYPETVELRFDTEDYDRIARVSILVKENDLLSARINFGGHMLLDEDGEESNFKVKLAHLVIFADGFMFYCEDKNCTYLESKSITIDELQDGFKQQN